MSTERDTPPRVSTLADWFSYEGSRDRLEPLADLLESEDRPVAAASVREAITALGALVTERDNSRAEVAALRARLEAAERERDIHERSASQRNAEIIAATAKLDERTRAVTLLREALSRYVPKENARGPWDHAFGCAAETGLTNNAPCTCGAWAQLNADRELLAATAAPPAAMPPTEER